MGKSLPSQLALFLITRQDDAQLTQEGILQAKSANKAWKQQIGYGIPLPQTFYSSPLRLVSRLQYTCPSC